MTKIDPERGQYDNGDSNDDEGESGDGDSDSNGGMIGGSGSEAVK